MTTVRSLPQEVINALKLNKKVKWGLYFEDSRRPVTADFRMVSRPKVEKQLTKLRRRKHIQRQPEVVRRVLEATILENNRLYTEALVENLQIAADNPNSSASYRGIVTTLRRLDGKDSELWATVAPQVTGSGKMRPTVAGRPAGRAGGSASALANWIQPTDLSREVIAQGPAEAGAGDIPSGDAPVTTPSDGGGHVAEEGVQTNPDGGNAPQPGQGEAGKPSDKDGATATGPDANTGDRDDKDGPAADVGGTPDQTPTEALQQARAETEALRASLQEAVNGDATPAQVQALHQAVRDAEAAVAQMNAAADRAEGGDANAQRAFERAQANLRNAQTAAGNAMPDDPSADPVPAQNAPATMEDAVRQIAQSGNNENAAKLLRVLRTAREAEAAATAADTSVTNARTAESAAEAALRGLGSDATDAERAAAAQAVQDARTAREEAESQSQTTRQNANQLRQNADQAVQRFGDVARQAQELMKDK